MLLMQLHLLCQAPLRLQDVDYKVVYGAEADRPSVRGPDTGQLSGHPPDTVADVVISRVPSGVGRLADIVQQSRGHAALTYVGDHCLTRWS
jgi:hypothetical protein